MNTPRPRPLREPSASSPLRRRDVPAPLESLLWQLLDKDPGLLHCFPDSPDYPPYGKRLLRDNHWFRMLKRENVDLIDEVEQRDREVR